MKIHPKWLLLACLLLSTHVSHAQTARPKVALVLGGGGAKGAAHVGVLRAIEQSGIRPDYVVGTSIGGIVGGLYCAGYSADEIEHLFRSQEWGSLLTDRVDSLSRRVWHQGTDGRAYVFGVPLPMRVGKDQRAAGSIRPLFESGKTGLLRGKQLSLLLDSMLRLRSVETFSQLPIPFRCVAVDVGSMEEVVLHSGPLAEAMRASMAIPGVFTSVRRDGHLLIDGGAINNLPVDVARGMGADIVIAVDLTQHQPKEKDRDQKNWEALPDIPQLHWFLSRPDRKRYLANRRSADFYIHPELKGYDAASFTPAKIDSMLQIGHRTGQAMLSELRALKLKIEKPQ